MKTIRNSLFETNSSSMHSVTVQDVKDKSHDHFEHDDVVKIALKYYGRSPQFLLTKPEQKLSYILSYYFGYCGSKVDAEKTCKLLTDYFNDKMGKTEMVSFMESNKQIFDFSEQDIEVVQKLHDCVKSHTNARFEIIFGDDYCIYAEGYEVMDKYFKSHDINEILFNPDYIIVIDGDEYCKYEDDREETYNHRSWQIEDSESLLNDPTDIWSNTKYDFADELKLRNQKPKPLTFTRLQRVISLGTENFDELEPYWDRNKYALDHFKGILYKGKLISKSKQDYIFYRRYNELVYGVPHLFHVVRELFNDNEPISELKILAPDEYFDNYDLKDCDVKITEKDNGFYLEFYEVKD